jgi:hypothetical protein
MRPLKRWHRSVISKPPGMPLALNIAVLLVVAVLSPAGTAVLLWWGLGRWTA